MRFKNVQDLYFDEEHIDNAISTLERFRRDYPDSFLKFELDHSLNMNLVLRSLRIETPEEAKVRYESQLDSYKKNESRERELLAMLKAKYEGNDD